MSLPDHARTVVAFLDGAKHHSEMAWRRTGWALMWRWDHGFKPEDVVADGWAREPYDRALKRLDADYATVTKWVYVEDLDSIATETGNKP